MTAPYTRAPHRGGPVPAGPESPHAALLIDFDNVTMGMRSDLSKELKSLLGSDVIKGKVSVQRAYADWRRYPQYIVPLSEASVDLIFAPAYGSNKKNATDIRMAIDALELVFTRPEIGTFILLTGDSDFSSLVLKLKEYGKYVIGVGIQESSSDILVQYCDEYYSYTSLTGLTKTTELTGRGRDPWVLVKDAVGKMVSRGDVMRSDRLKQVMQELDPNFDERAIGFSKFSKFLTEASTRGLVQLMKVGNGQYEVGPGKGRSPRPGEGEQPRSRRDRGRGGRRERREPPTPPSEQPVAAAGSPAGPLEDAYALLRAA
ncbi:MAG TPA: NYN domain-containing protein, partial [Longimicrobiales bacterium]|nr:NYN domain-containing protein [Longimicrobiales bacterium]